MYIAVDEAKLFGLFSGARSMANQDVESTCGSVFTLKLLFLSFFHSICVLHLCRCDCTAKCDIKKSSILTSISIILLNSPVMYGPVYKQIVHVER